MQYRAATEDEYILAENADNQQYGEHIRIAREDVWLDIGAHIGAFAVQIAPYVAGVYCFEPEHENFGLLMQNIRRLDNTRCYLAAVVGTQTRGRRLHVYGQGKTSWHSLVDKPPYERTVYVGCLDIRTVLDLSHANSIKLDVEGLEFEILMAVEGYADIEQIVFEWHPHLAGEENFTPLMKRLSQDFPYTWVKHREGEKNTLVTVRKFL
jgi:FkbM family methyltransferase